MVKHLKIDQIQLETPSEYNSWESQFWRYQQPSPCTTGFFDPLALEKMFFAVPLQ